METIIDFSTANFIQFSLSNDHSIGDILTKPAEVASKMNLTLTPMQLKQIDYLNTIPEREKLSALSSRSKDFIKEVLKDGRYLLDWKNKPKEVGDRLGISIGPDVVKELEDIDLKDFIDPDASQLVGPRIGIISIAIAVILGSQQMAEEPHPILDFSKVEKI